METQFLNKMTNLNKETDTIATADSLAGCVYVEHACMAYLFACRLSACLLDAGYKVPAFPYIEIKNFFFCILPTL